MKREEASGVLGVLAKVGLEKPAQREMAAFLELLTRFERVTNLRGPGKLTRPLEDTLAALAGAEYLEGVATLVDIGSGNGFPAIPLLIARRELAGMLLEPRERRWAFLREVVRELQLNAVVCRESVRRHRGGPYGALSCRGVAGREWLAEVARLVKPGGVVLYWGAAGWVGREPGERVLPSPISTPGGSLLHVWRRCFT